MRISQMAKNMWKYMSVLAVLVATAIGVLIGKDLYPASFASQLKTPTLLPADPNGWQPLIVPGEISSCDFSLIFTSLPPKCKASDGSFIQANGTSPYVILIPGTK